MKYVIFFNLFKFIFLSLVLFFISILGIFITRKNLILILMSIELMFLSINFLLLNFSIYLDDIVGQIFSFYVLAVVASESAIGLALIVIFYRLRGVISIDYISSIKG